MPTTQSRSMAYTGTALREPMVLRRWRGNARPPHTSTQSYGVVLLAREGKTFGWVADGCGQLLNGI